MRAKGDSVVICKGKRSMRKRIIACQRKMRILVSTNSTNKSGKLVSKIGCTVRKSSQFGLDRA